MPNPLVPLTDADVVDNHCHGFVVDELLSSEPESFEGKLTLTGQAFLTSNQRDPAIWRSIEALVTDNVYSNIARRWLCEFLGCPDDCAALVQARDVAMRANPIEYTRRLLADQNIVQLVADEGYTHMPVAGAQLEQLVGVPVRRVARIESFMDAVLARADPPKFDDFVDDVQAQLEQAASDERTIALKSIIAYRTGLDVAAPSSSEASSAYVRWRNAGWSESRDHSKLVRDFVLHRAMSVIDRHNIALHIHCGDGDLDVKFQHSRPQDLFPFLRTYSRQPIVLMHAGHPWSEEASYLASVIPNVYIDLSVLIPWASMNIEHYLFKFLGMMPSRKLLYGSDQVYEPELFWLPARFARWGLERALSKAVEGDYISIPQATTIGRGILGDNTRRLHAI